MDRAREHAKALMHINSDPSHDFAHVERVCVLAKKLARQCGCNATIVELAALFHDVYDHEYERGRSCGISAIFNETEIRIRDDCLERCAKWA